MKRIDRRIGRLHYIRRSHENQEPQYGFLCWGSKYYSPTLDIWIHGTLITLRWTDEVR